MTANVLSNRISLSIPDDDLQAINDALQTLEQKLLPHLVSLGTDDRRGLARMGDKTVTFVTKTAGYARSHPEFRPGFVDMDEFQRDVDAVELLRPIQQVLTQLNDMVDDSVTLAGSEAYTAALACYQTVKSAAKLSQPGAVSIYDDLSARFQGMGRGGRPAPIASNPTPGANA